MVSGLDGRRGVRSAGTLSASQFGYVIVLSWWRQCMAWWWWWWWVMDVVYLSCVCGGVCVCVCSCMHMCVCMCACAYVYASVCVNVCKSMANNQGMSNLALSVHIQMEW